MDPLAGRWLQWHWKGADGPGERRSDITIMADLFLRLREMYRKQGGAFPDPILGLHWPYRLTDAPSPEEIAREINGYVVRDITDPKISPLVEVWKGAAKPIALIGLGLTALFGFFHYVTAGPNEVGEADEEEAKKTIGEPDQKRAGR